MTRSYRTWIAALAAVFVVAAAAPSSAAPILSPVAATASATLDGSINHTIDQTGLAPGFISGVTDFDAYMALNPTHDAPGPGNAWSAAAGNLPIDLDFDLGSVYDIGRLALWTSFQGFSINRFMVFTALDASFAGAVNVGAFDADDTLPPMMAQVFDLAASSGRYLRVQILSNEGAGAVNLSEIGVEVDQVPEPATLLLIGTALVGAGLRRRVGRA